MDQIPGVIVILGPTASGKTSLAVDLAKRVNGSIISADSRQVFKGMDIGTGKDLHEYDSIAHYLIDIRDAGTNYHVAHFQDDFQESLLAIRAQDKTPILCGGTGMYIQSVLQGYTFTTIPRNEELRLQLESKDIEELEKLFLSLRKPTTIYKADISTKKRLIRAIEIIRWFQKYPDTQMMPAGKLSAQVFGISLPLEIRRDRITRRLKQRLENGLVEEVKTLLAQGISTEKLLFYGLEYKYITSYLLGKLNEEELFTKLNTEIHRFAKRQMTYFRKMEKDGIFIHWLDGTKPTQENTEEIIRLLKKTSYKSP